MGKDRSKKLWSIGGGKGGVGKSVFTLGLGISLAQLGKRVILMDGDLGGANLHTLMGLRYPPRTLEDFLLKKVDHLEDIVIYTQIEGIGLICGADDILGAANPTYAQKLRILNQIEELPADFVLLDLGAGTSYNVLDFFNYTPGKICLLTNQATSLQNVYGFIKSALYRQISREFAKDHDFLNLLLKINDENSPGKPDSLCDIIRGETNRDRLSQLLRLLRDYQIFLVVNMVKSDRDLQASLVVEKVCSSYLSLSPQLLGHLSYDLAVEQAVNQMAPFPSSQKKKTQGAVDLQHIAQLILEKFQRQVQDLENWEQPASKENGKSAWSRLWNWGPREVQL